MSSSGSRWRLVFRRRRHFYQAEIADAAVSSVAAPTGSRSLAIVVVDSRLASTGFLLARRKSRTDCARWCCCSRARDGRGDAADSCDAERLARARSAH